MARGAGLLGPNGVSGREQLQNPGHEILCVNVISLACVTFGEVTLPLGASVPSLINKSERSLLLG